MFTWSNRRFEADLVEERLDRFLCNKGWGNYFQEKAVVNLVSWCSDHHLILMELVEKGKWWNYMKKTFYIAHYEDMWGPYKRCKEIIKGELSDNSYWSWGNPVELFKKKSKKSLAELKL